MDGEVVPEAAMDGVRVLVQLPVVRVELHGRDLLLDVFVATRREPWLRSGP